MKKKERDILVSKYEDLRGYPSGFFNFEDWKRFDAFVEGYLLAKKELSENK